MIPVEVLKQVTDVFCHKNCADGTASAMILKDAFRMLGTEPTFTFLAYNTPEHKAAQATSDGSRVLLFCDFTPWAPSSPGTEQGRADLLELMTDHANKYADVIVLDHHAGAEDVVACFGSYGVFADIKTEPGVSGAVLAYREVWGPVHQFRYAGLTNNETRENRQLTREFAEYVGMRDTWQTQIKLSFLRGQWINSMLMAKPTSYWLDEDGKGRPILPYLNAAEVEGGRCLFEAHTEEVRKGVASCVSWWLAREKETDRSFDRTDTVVLHAFQGLSTVSDVSEELRRQDEGREAHDPSAGLPGVVAGFSYVVEKPGQVPKLAYSLRSLNGFDVCALAKRYGGGGHKAAAGFSLTMEQCTTCLDPLGKPLTRNPYDLIRFLVVAYMDELRAAAQEKNRAEQEPKPT